MGSKDQHLLTGAEIGIEGQKPLTAPLPTKTALLWCWQLYADCSWYLLSSLVEQNLKSVKYIQVVCTTGNRIWSGALLPLFPLAPTHNSNY